MVTQSDKKKVGKRVGKLFQSVNKMKLPREESSRSADQGLPTVVRQRVLSRARLGELEAYKGHHITAPEERGHLRGERTEGEASLPPRQRETLQTKQQEKETDKQIKIYYEFLRGPPTLKLLFCHFINTTIIGMKRTLCCSSKSSQTALTRDVVGRCG